MVCTDQLPVKSAIMEQKDGGTICNERLMPAVTPIATAQGSGLHSPRATPTSGVEHQSKVFLSKRKHVVLKNERKLHACSSKQKDHYIRDHLQEQHRRATFCARCRSAHECKFFLPLDWNTVQRHVSCAVVAATPHHGISAFLPPSCDDCGLSSDAHPN